MCNIPPGTFPLRNLNPFRSEILFSLLCVIILIVQSIVKNYFNMTGKIPSVSRPFACFFKYNWYETGGRAAP